MSRDTHPDHLKPSIHPSHSILFCFSITAHNYEYASDRRNHCSSNCQAIRAAANMEFQELGVGPDLASRERDLATWKSWPMDTRIDYRAWLEDHRKYLQPGYNFLDLPNGLTTDKVLAIINTMYPREHV